jgi:hypothetical protein
MSASEHLGPQFRKDKTDREESKNAYADDYSGSDGDDLLDYQYERVGREDIDVDPRRERKARVIG